MFAFTRDIAVLDITSRLISAIFGAKTAQSVFGIKSVVESEYSGFENGEWLDLPETENVVRTVLSEAIASSRTRTKRLFVGVPAEFTAVVTKEVSIRLDRERRVLDADIDYLINKGNTFSDGGYSVINTAPMEFVIDTSNRVYSDVRGLRANSVKGVISYILCENSFVELFDRLSEELGFKDISYISTAWAEGLSLFEKEERDNPYVLVDIGYISSSILIGRGDGIIDLASFSLGGGHISADMCESLDVPFGLAEQARELVDLNLNYAENAILVADAENTIYGNEAAELVRLKLELFADIIYDAVNKSLPDMPSYVPVFLTGEGVAAIRGTKKYLGNAIGRSVEIVMPKLAGYAKPANSTKISLLMTAETLSKNRTGLFKRKD